MPISTSLRRMTRFPAYASFPTFPLSDFPSMSKLLSDTFEFAPLPETFSFVPATEIIETPTELLFTVELPGMTKKDIELNVEDGVLTLKGKKFEEYKEDEENLKYHVWERIYGAFERAFRLPLTVDATKVNAEFVDGVLKIHLPKTVKSAPNARKVEIFEKK